MKTDRIYKVDTLPPGESSDPYEKVTAVGDWSLAVKEALRAQQDTAATRKVASFDLESALAETRPPDPVRTSTTRLRRQPSVEDAKPVVHERPIDTKAKSSRARPHVAIDAVFFLCVLIGVATIVGSFVR